VEDRSEDGPGLKIRLGGQADAPYVVALGTAAFARFGDYAPIMTSFLQSPDVASFIAWTAGQRVGFALVDRPPEVPGLADLVAIAVEPSHRRSGVGRALMAGVIAACEARGEPSVLVLTVADDNRAAIGLFRAFDFHMLPGSLGRYAGGQRSRRMARNV
jgi:ribosomal-protein-alanine N-acetyltransferase